MTLQSSGPISFQQINEELTQAATATISLNDSNVRQLLRKTSGTISMQDAYGRSNGIRYINTSALKDVSIFNLMGLPTTAAHYIFENQAEISARSLSYALRTGVFPPGSSLTIINNGYIYGKGGSGSNSHISPGDAGGDAIYLDMPCRIINSNGYILAGGGGGGTAYMQTPSSQHYLSGGGGGGAGLTAGSPGSNFYRAYSSATSTPSGGQSATTGGTGGVVNSSWSSYNETAYGGAGGANGAPGTVGSTISQGTTSYKTITKIGVAGAAGRAIITNGKELIQIAGFDSSRVKGAIV